MLHPSDHLLIFHLIYTYILGHFNTKSIQQMFIAWQLSARICVKCWGNMDDQERQRPLIMILVRERERQKLLLLNNNKYN